MSAFKNFANKAKDLALQGVATWLANRFHLNKLGKVKNLQLDSGKAQVFMTLLLEGEDKPVDLTVHYRIVSPTEIEVIQVHASRPWMSTFANELVPKEQKRFTVAPMVVKALSTWA